jgi:hypothetical protein
MCHANQTDDSGVIAPMDSFWIESGHKNAAERMGAS